MDWLHYSDQNTCIMSSTMLQLKNKTCVVKLLPLCHKSLEVEVEIMASSMSGVLLRSLEIQSAGRIGIESSREWYWKKKNAWKLIIIINIISRMLSIRAEEQRTHLRELRTSPAYLFNTFSDIF